jgi:hypothetical protein
MVTGVVEGYLAAVATQDWNGLRAAVRDDIVRVGPYGDTYTGVESYVAFLSALMPTLPGYAMEISRVTYVDEGRRAFAELSETVEIEGRSTVTPEVLVFDLDESGLIARVEIYTRRT